MAVGHHIRHPLEWGWDELKVASRATGKAAHSVIGSEQARRAAPPRVAVIHLADLKEALRKGLDDFVAYRSDVVFLCLIYPVLGLALWQLAAGNDMLHLVFPLVSGFALVGPVAAMGLYELSRRRERRMRPSWEDAFAVVRSPALGAIVTLGLVLAAIFALWIIAANEIYAATLGPQSLASIQSFLVDLFTTSSGWVLIGVGVGVGFLFALLVLALSVVSFPLLLDRDVGLVTAVRTSVRAVLANPGPMAMWGLIIAGGLVIGSIPALIGLAIILPILGHATWHLYRRMVPR